MKEIQDLIEDVIKLNNKGDDWGDIGLASLFIAHYNTVLETQALALEEMIYPHCDAQWRSSDTEGASCEGKNEALQEAADHLRAQKIALQDK